MTLSCLGCETDRPTECYRPTECLKLGAFHRYTSPQECLLVACKDRRQLTFWSKFYYWNRIDVFSFPWNSTLVGIMWGSSSLWFWRWSVQFVIKPVEIICFWKYVYPWPWLAHLWRRFYVAWDHSHVREVVDFLKWVLNRKTLLCCIRLSPFSSWGFDNSECAFSFSPPGTSFLRRNRSATWHEFADPAISQLYHFWFLADFGININKGQQFCETWKALHSCVGIAIMNANNGDIASEHWGHIQWWSNNRFKFGWYAI